MKRNWQNSRKRIETIAAPAKRDTEKEVETERGTGNG